MKKVILTLSFLSTITLSANASPSKTSTIMIDLDSVSQSAVQTIKTDDSSTIKSNIDLTHLVAFVKNWREKESRKKELLNLYSSVIPQAFKKYPNSKEFQFSTYVNYKNKSSNKNQIKSLSNIIVTKDDIAKINWKALNIDNIDSNKYIKKVNFSDL